MPAYDYRCKACKQVFEIRASMADYDDGLDATCPMCGSDYVTRVFSTAAFVTAGGSPAAAARRQPAPNPHNCGCGGACRH